MKLKLKIYILFILGNLLVFVGNITAQDFHLSHYNANPLYINPALTGMKVGEDWDFRINGNYREQGGNAYKSSNSTISIGCDKPLNNKFALGGYIIDNKSMNGLFNTMNGLLSASYNIIHTETGAYSKHNFSIGLQLGFLYKSLNPSSFTYDAQYSPTSVDGFDTSIPSGETFAQENVLRLDANFGVFYRYYNREKKVSPFGGIALYHLSQPNESYTGSISRTPMRFTLHGGCYYKISDEFTVLPQVLYMYQIQANEINFELLGFYKIKNTPYQPMLGLSWRNKDAVVYHIGLKYKYSVFRISYDGLISHLKDYNSGRGGIELSVVYCFRKKRDNEFKSLDK